MIALAVLFGLLSCIVAALYGRARARSDLDALQTQAKAQLAATEERERLAAETKVREAQAGDIAESLARAAPPSLSAAERRRRTDEWVRTYAKRVDADPRNDSTVHHRAAADPDRKPD